MSGIPSHFTRENGEGFWGAYETMTDLHYEDGWREEIIPVHNHILEKLGVPYYNANADVVTYEVIERTDLPLFDLAKADKIKEVKLATRNLLVETDYYIVRRAETGKSVPQTILNDRQAIRAWSDALEKAVMALPGLEDVIRFELIFK